MDLLELLQSMKTSLDELSQTDGFQSFKEAGGKVNAARNALFAVMDKAGDMVNAIAEDKAKALAEEAVKENFVTKEDHDKALVELKAEGEKAIEEAKGKWDSEQAGKDAKATITAERIEKFREMKVEKVPDAIKDVIESMSADEEGNKAFDEMVGKLTARRKACEDAKVKLSANVDSRIVQTLASTDEVFKETLDLWKSLVTGKVEASKGKKSPFIPSQEEGSEEEKEMIGVC